MLIGGHADGGVLSGGGSRRWMRRVGGHEADGVKPVYFPSSPLQFVEGADG